MSMHHVDGSEWRQWLMRYLRLSDQRYFRCPRYFRLPRHIRGWAGFYLLWGDAFANILACHVFTLIYALLALMVFVRYIWARQPLARRILMLRRAPFGCQRQDAWQLGPVISILVDDIIAWLRRYMHTRRSPRTALKWWRAITHIYRESCARHIRGAPGIKYFLEIFRKPTHACFIFTTRRTHFTAAARGRWGAAAWASIQPCTKLVIDAMTTPPPRHVLPPNA